MATLLIGYDVECVDDDATTPLFIERALRAHEALDAPCTLFCTGMVLHRHAEALQPLRGHPLFDFEQHTYSHALLKTVVAETPDGIRLNRGASLPEIEREVTRAQAALREVMGVTGLGITGPYCYYRGLADRPDILEILHDCGIRFTRTYGRNERDWQPVDLAVQPFWYGPQGFADVLELPLQGWQDCIWREEHGWQYVGAYVDHLRTVLDELAGTDRTWSYGSHDWSSIREDGDHTVIRRLVEMARERGIELITHRAYYERERARAVSAKAYTSSST